VVLLQDPSLIAHALGLVLLHFACTNEAMSPNDCYFFVLAILFEEASMCLSQYRGVIVVYFRCAKGKLYTFM
jgi:hypothetical protein